MTLQPLHPWRFTFFRGASCSVKFRHPIDNDQTSHLAIARCKVNATRQNKIIMFDRQIESG